MFEYSLIIPVYNEEECLNPLLLEIESVMSRLDSPFEVVFIDDCSSDKSADILDHFKKEKGEQVKVVHLEQRSGQTFAMRRGIEEAKGKVFITLDADLQNDPNDIPFLLAKMSEGYDMVCGWRKNRQDKALKAVLSKTGNFLQRFFTGIKIHDISCTLRAFKRECACKIPLNWEGQHRFIPLSLSLQGYKIGEIISNHRQRSFGYSKYSHKRIFKVMVDWTRILLMRGRK